MYICVYCVQGYKRYRADAILGHETDTLDSTGVITHESPCDHITLDKIENELKTFHGNILQIPPMYSALNHEGKRLYELARAGIEIDRPAREVEVKALSLIRGEDVAPLPSFTLEMETSGGFYVRSLIRDIGNCTREII